MQWFTLFANGFRLGKIFTSKEALQASMPNARLSFDRECVTIINRP